MKIAAIAGRYGKPSPSCTVLPEWTWVETVEEMLHHQDADIFIDLGFEADEKRINVLSRLSAPVLIDSDIVTLQDIGRPFIRINAWPGWLEREVQELAVPNEESAHRIKAVFEALGWKYRIVPDVPGMVSSRIVATIINEAWFTLQEEVSTEEEIDAAMRLGTNYPFGPFEWCRKIGSERVHRLLMALSEQEPRYRPAKAFSQTIKKLKID